MNETLANATSSARHGKDLSLDSPLLNLILAASLLSRFTRTKSSSSPPSYSRAPPLPYRYSENYYEALPYYPHDNGHYYKLQASLNTQHANFPIRQHVIHIHNRPVTPPPSEEVPEEVGASTVTTARETPTTSIPEDPVDFETTQSPANDDLQQDEILASPSTNLVKELKEFLTDFFKNNHFASPQNDPKVISEEEVQKLSAVLPEITLEEISKEITDVPDEKIVENMSETMVDKMADTLRENATESEVKHMSETVIQNLPASILESIPPEMLEKISGMISDQISEKLSEKFSKDVSNHMLEKLSQLIPEKNVNSEENKISNVETDKFPVFTHNSVEEAPEVIREEGKPSEEESQDANLVSAASNVDLQPMQSVKVKKTSRTSTGDDEYVFSGNDPDEDDDEDEEDVLDDQEVDLEQELPHKMSPKFSQRIRLTTEAAKRQKGKISHQQSQERINSKKPSGKRRTTPSALIYDEYDEATPTVQTNKRKVQFYNGVAKITNTRRTNSDEEETSAQRPLRKQGSGKRRSTSTTTPPPNYNDYYDDPVESEENDQNQEYEEEAVTIKPRPTKRPRPAQRQAMTTTEVTTVTDTGATDETTITSTTQMSNVTTTTQATTNATSGQYPYYGNNNYDNISITYGPPVHHYPGYGPSNGNEHVSFTYAPPSSAGGSGFAAASGDGATGTGVAPMVDGWYNQYAKASMYKRIQDLLTPNNYYNQYDVNYAQ